MPDQASDPKQERAQTSISPDPETSSGPEPQIELEQQPESIPAPPVIPAESEEEPTPMLDVHPAPHAAHTWKDFFIHIATICLGLLIAVGLEQTVEYFHHRLQVSETRKELGLEREQNRRAYALNVPRFRLLIAESQNNLRVLTFLQTHPNLPEEKLPGTLVWDTGGWNFDESVWDNAVQTGVAALMPREEGEANTRLYAELRASHTAADEFFGAITTAANYALVDPNPAHLSPAQVQTEIDLARKAMQQGLIWGIMMHTLSATFPDFTPALTHDELSRLSNSGRSDADRKKLAPATAITDSELAAPRAALKAAQAF